VVDTSDGGFSNGCGSMHEGKHGFSSTKKAQEKKENAVSQEQQ
jgi:hypothetical protein